MSNGNVSWDDLQNKYGMNYWAVQEAKNAGQTPQQALQQQQNNLLTGALTAPSGGGQGSQGSQSSGTQGRVNQGIGGDVLSNIAQSITSGSGGGSSGGGTSMGSGVDQSNFLGNLGTLTMRSALGTSQIPIATNPQPQSGNLSIGGIADVGSPTYSMPTNQALQSSLFPGPWSQVAQSAGLSTQQITKFQKQGLTPTQVAAKFKVAAPTTGGMPPGILGGAATGATWAQAPTQTTALQPTTPATAVSGGSSGINPIQLAGVGAPPAAPGMPQIQTPATPAPFTGTIHTDPAISGAVTSLLGLGSNPWHPNYTAGETIGPSTGGSALAAAGAQPGVRKMAAGGQVRKEATQPQYELPLNPMGMTGAQMPTLPGMVTAQNNPVQGANLPAAPPGYQMPQFLSPQQVMQWYQQGQPPPAPTEQRMAAGGHIRGDTDTVPAMLSPGEYVVNRDAVRKVGVGALNRINHMKEGGSVEGPAPDQGGDRDSTPEGSGSFSFGGGGRGAPGTAQRRQQGQPRQANWQYGAPAAQPAAQQPQSSPWAAAPQMTPQEHDWMMQRPAGYGDTLPATPQPGSQGHPYYGTPYAYGTPQYADYWNAAYGKNTDPFGPGGVWDVTQPVRRMADGGSVDNEPPEARFRGSLSTASGATQPTQPTMPSRNDIAAGSATINNLAATGSNPFSTLGLLARREFQNQEATAQAGGSAPGLGRAAQMAWNTGTDPNAGLPAGASGYLGTSGQPVGSQPGGAAVSPTAMAGSAIGSIGSAISDAVNKWASSIGSWKMQPNAIPTPPPARQTPVQFAQQQPPEGQQQQRQMNPYLLAQYGPPGYPYV